MWPIVVHLEIAGLVRPLTSYGMCAIIGILLGFVMIDRLAHGRGLPRFEVAVATTLGIAFGLLGAKLLFLIVSIPRILAEGILPFLDAGGFVFYGGLLGGSIGILIYLRSIQMPFLPFADVAAPGLALAHALGRIGCFLFGCCYGKPTAMPWGVRFPETPFFEGPVETTLHPVQLYESGFELALMAALLLCLRRKPQLPDGAIFFAWSVGYALFRFIVEVTLRGDDRGLGMGTLPPSALLSLVLFIIAGACVVVVTMRSTRSTKESKKALKARAHPAVDQ